MIRKFFAIDWVKRFIHDHTTKLYCRIYGHTYLITYNKPHNETVVNLKCHCYQCRTLYGHMKFPLYLFITRVNPQFRTAVEKWLTDIGISSYEIDQLIKHLQRDRIAKITAINVRKNKSLHK